MTNDASPRTTDEIEDLFARDGHLTLLTFDRFEQGELSVYACEAVIEHLRGCSVCTHRMSLLDDVPSIEPPMPRVAPRKPDAARNVAIGVTLAAAASLLLFVWPEPEHARHQPTENTLTAGAYSTTAALESPAHASVVDFDLRAYIGEPPRRVHHGDAVRWGEAVTLEVRVNEPGFVGIVLAEEHGDQDLGEGTGGPVSDGTQIRVLQSVRAIADGEPLTVIYDDEPEPGVARLEQRLVAILCPETFSLDPQDGFDLELPTVLEGCNAQELTVTRAGGFADS